MSRQSSGMRESWADMCRLLAIFGVILIHTSAPVFYEFRTISLDKFLVANLIDSMARVSVPLFIMLSGALLLGRNSGTVWEGRRILKVLIPLVFWSFVHLFWLNVWAAKPLNVVEATVQILQAPAMYHLWFVYMIIGIYLLLPMLRVISVAIISDKKMAIYLFSLWVVINSITIYYPIGTLQLLKLPNTLAWPGYFILGYYLATSETFKGISSRLSGFIFIAASLSTFALSWRINAASLTPNETAFEYFSPNVLIASCAAFVWIRKIEIQTSLVKPLEYLSSLVFPVYCMHILIIELLKGGLLGFSITPYTIHPLLGISALALSTLIVSMLITLLLRQIPYVSKVIG